MSAGRLSVVATPIGALDDITVRALSVLRSADAILAEDTRRTRILTEHHGITTRLRSFHAHTKDGTRDAILDELEAGAHFALVSDAGTPLVSDPGADLVDLARTRGITVEHLPGASAVLTALCVAGLRCDDFRFVGFLPRTGARRRGHLDAMAASEAATVFFESPHRVHRTLEELATRLSPVRRIAVTRELTKLHEEVVRGSVTEVLAALAEPVLGEVTVVVEGLDRPEELELDAASLDERIDAMVREGLPAKAIAKALAESAGVSTRELYARVIAKTKRG